MSDPTLDPAAALVLIDLQQGILDLSTVTPSARILAGGVRLACAFRASNQPVALVKVAWPPDGGDLPTCRADRPGISTPPPSAFSELPAELATGSRDIVITKRQQRAVTGTELDLQLRQRGITQIVLASTPTSIGLESTARPAWVHGYRVTVVEDATTDLDAGSRRHSFTKIFPRLGQVTTTERVLEIL
ncbi:isochorismatase family protein [Streptomyces sp. NPDC001262]|uniref:isochorismatase family protein n=1 Tax=Streptomyces sp. NPDC001262 TaxID=3364552 RepID=UPI0036AD595E